jgi:hypothetical protein
MLAATAVAGWLHMPGIPSPLQIERVGSGLLWLLAQSFRICAGARNPNVQVLPAPPCGSLPMEGDQLQDRVGHLPYRLRDGLQPVVQRHAGDLVLLRQRSLRLAVCDARADRGNVLSGHLRRDDGW